METRSQEAPGKIEEAQGLERYIGERFNLASLASSRLSKESQIELLEWLKPPIFNFLILRGDPGVGKTWLAVAIGRHIFRSAQKRVRFPSIFFYPQEKIYEEIRDCYQYRKSETELMDRFAQCMLLVIDDLGSSRNNEWQAEKMSQIIRSRYDNRKATVITTNLLSEEIGKSIDPRVQDRLDALENTLIQDWSGNLREEGL